MLIIKLNELDEVYNRVDHVVANYYMSLSLADELSCNNMILLPELKALMVLLKANIEEIIKQMFNYQRTIYSSIRNLVNILKSEKMSLSSYLDMVRNLLVRSFGEIKQFRKYFEPLISSEETRLYKIKEVLNYHYMHLKKINYIASKTPNLTFQKFLGAIPEVVFKQKGKWSWQRGHMLVSKNDVFFLKHDRYNDNYKIITQVPLKSISSIYLEASIRHGLALKIETIYEEEILIKGKKLFLEKLLEWLEKVKTLSRRNNSNELEILIEKMYREPRLNVSKIKEPLDQLILRINDFQISKTRTFNTPR